MVRGGAGGITFGAVTSPAIGGQVGVQIAPGLFVIGEVGRMTNALPKNIRDQFEEEIDDLIGESGLDIVLEFKMPATYGFGGIRWAPAGRAVAPFLEAGVGTGRLNFKVTKFEIEGEDFLSELEDEIGGPVTTTELLIAFGGGVTARLNRSTSFDAGYRFTRINTEDPAVNISMVYAAIKFGR